MPAVGCRLPCIHSSSRHAGGMLGGRRNGRVGFAGRACSSYTHAQALEGDVTVWTSQVHSMKCCSSKRKPCHPALQATLEPSNQRAHLMSSPSAQCTCEIYSPASVGAFMARRTQVPHKCGASPRPPGAHATNETSCASAKGSLDASTGDHATANKMCGRATPLGAYRSDNAGQGPQLWQRPARVGSTPVWDPAFVQVTQL